MMRPGAHTKLHPVLRWLRIAVCFPKTFTKAGYTHSLELEELWGNEGRTSYPAGSEGDGKGSTQELGGSGVSSRGDLQ